MILCLSRLVVPMQMHICVCHLEVKCFWLMKQLWWLLFLYSVSEGEQSSALFSVLSLSLYVFIRRVLHFFLLSSLKAQLLLLFKHIC